MASARATKPGRKFHHKSRYGCAPCKRRRIKCDENRPICNNCSQRSIDCPLQHLEPATNPQKLSTMLVRRASRPVTLAIPAQVSDPIAPGLSFCRTQTRDLELYCHFQLYTAGTFTYPLPVEQLFREFIPNLSSSFPFVGHGLLSIAYTHLASLSQQGASSTKLLTEAAFHVNRAIPGYSSAIETITQENSTALFTFAIFVILFTFASTSEDADAIFRNTDKSMLSKEEVKRALARNAARVPRAVQNIFSIFWRCQQWISKGPLFPVIRRYIPATLDPTRMNWVYREDEQLARVSLLWTEDESLAPELKTALTDAHQALRETFGMVTQLTVMPNADPNGPGALISDSLEEIHRQLSAGRLDDIPSVFTWFIRLSPAFVGLMEEGNVYAMVVVAHFAILLDRACTTKWWLHRMAQHFLAAAEVVLGESRRDWIEWPLTVIQRTPRVVSA